MASLRVLALGLLLLRIGNGDSSSSSPQHSSLLRLGDGVLFDGTSFRSGLSSLNKGQQLFSVSRDNMLNVEDVFATEPIGDLCCPWVPST